MFVKVTGRQKSGSVVTRFGSTNPVRAALPSDVPAIIALVDEHARRGELLPRTAASIEQTVADWYVGVLSGRIVACVSLLSYGPHLAEVRSLAVHDQVKGQGWGTAVVRALIAEAERRQIPRLFALTRTVPFFERCGFTVTDRLSFPEKVWRDCRQCPLKHHCDETAVVLDLQPATSGLTQAELVEADFDRLNLRSRSYDLNI
jgi:N-acetylglutamate synthase-like GNAT family acetyltransferase